MLIRKWPHADRKKECAHAVPTFGCQACIDQDRFNVLKRKYEDLKTPIPICPECGKTMFMFEWDIKALKLYFTCPQTTQDGERFCDTEEVIAA